MSIVGLYANLADFQPRALDIRVQISAAPYIPALGYRSLLDLPKAASSR